MNSSFPSILHLTACVDIGFRHMRTRQKRFVPIQYLCFFSPKVMSDKNKFTLICGLPLIPSHKHSSMRVPIVFAVFSSVVHAPSPLFLFQQLNNGPVQCWHIVDKLNKAKTIHSTCATGYKHWTVHYSICVLF